MPARLIRESPYMGLLRQSRSIDRYREQWASFRGGLFDGGSLLAVRSSVLAGPGDDGIAPIANHILDLLFGTRRVRALGGWSAAASLSQLLRQFSSRDPRRLIVVLVKPRSLVLMQDELNHRVETAVIVQRETNQPDVIPYDPEKRLVLPTALGTRRSPLRFLHEDNRHAPPLLTATKDWATSNGVSRYQGEQWMFGCIPEEGMESVRGGSVWVPSAYRRRTEDGVSLTQEVPTLTVFELAPIHNQIINTRLAINFTPDGEHIAALTTKTSDLDDFLEFYPSEFERVLQGALRG